MVHQQPSLCRDPAKAWPTPLGVLKSFSVVGVDPKLWASDLPKPFLQFEKQALMSLMSIF